MKGYAVYVVGKDGKGKYVCEGLTQQPSRFPSRAAAGRQKQFMLCGMAREVQSINVVPYPGISSERKANL